MCCQSLLSLHCIDIFGIVCSEVDSKELQKDLTVMNS